MFIIIYYNFQNHHQFLNLSLDALSSLFYNRQNCLIFVYFTDPFADAIKGSDEDVQDGLVHIRIQQRNGRKTLTTVQGLSTNYDLKKIVRTCKKVRNFY